VQHDPALGLRDTDGIAAVPHVELRGRWVRQRLTAAGFDGEAGSVAAVRAPRTVAEGPSVLQAVAFAKGAAAAGRAGWYQPVSAGQLAMSWYRRKLFIEGHAP
jgi:hypothetical protein